MANLRKSIEEFELKHINVVTHIIVGKHYNDYTDKDRRPDDQRNRILTRDEGLALLDHDYDDGYGGAECHPFCAWTQDYILFVSEYDGATDMNYIPRNPRYFEAHFE